MDSFDSISEVLKRHLPRPATGSLVHIDAHGLTVKAPGINVGDMLALLSELTGHDEMLPSELVPTGLTLESLSLRRSLRNRGADLDFELTWKGAGLMIAERYPLQLKRLVFAKHGTRLLGFAEAVLTLDDLQLEVSVELPSQIITGRLAPTKHSEGAGFLAGRGLASSGVKLRELAVSASIPFHHAVLHIELENLFTIGPITLTEAEAELVLAGEQEGSAAQARAEMRIDVAGHSPVLVGIEGGVDSHGWRLAGHVEMDPDDINIGKLTTAIDPKAPPLPSVIADLGLVHLAASIDTHDGSFSFDCQLSWSHDAALTIHLGKSKHRLQASGTLVVAGLTFRVVFDSQADSALLVGAFEAGGHASLTLDEVLSAMSLDANAVLGAGGTGTTLGIKTLALALDSSGHMLLAGEVDAGIDLTRLGKLPLIGALLPSEKPLGLSVTPVFLGKDFVGADQAKTLLPGSLDLPGSLSEGLQLTASLQLGDNPISLGDIGLATSPQSVGPPELEAGGKPAAAATSMTAQTSATEISWTEVDKTLGPLHIARVGHRLKRKGGAEIDLEIDASLSIGGLSLGVSGLGARYDFTSRKLTPRLRGLGVDLQRGPIQIGGAFLNLDGDFAGKIVVGTPQFSLNALGMFKMLEDAPSMFVYGVLSMPLGGPPFFFIEGLAAGFGVHRKITMPTIDAVHSFPLVSSATSSALGQPADEDPEAQLTALHNYVTPHFGQHFFAVGIKFNSFKLLNGFVVLIVSVGEEFEVDLIGTANLSTPPELPPGVPALARIELDLIARFQPAEGFLAVEARLNPKSYVYSPMCHLSGGFAFYTWMKGARTGDFVLSLGGYHPKFVVPPDYPRVPRIELKYQVSPDIYIKGDAYFAMTPSVMMAGGGLHAQITLGALHAWADLSVDFLVAWEPFHYDAMLHLGIGAQWKCFQTQATADLHIWGPEFSGTASVDWFVFSFDVEFGPKVPHVPVPLLVAKFKSSFLQIDGTPDSASAGLGIVPTGGVHGENKGRPVVSPAELTVGCSLRVPVTTATLGAKLKPLVLAAAELGVAPMNLADIGNSAVNITVWTMDGKTDVTSRFTAEPVQASVPAALWGKTLKVDPNAGTIPATTEFQLRPAKPPVAPNSKPSSVRALQMEGWASIHSVRMLGFLHEGPVPTELPSADLQLLGLPTEGLVPVVVKPGLPAPMQVS